MACKKKEIGYLSDDNKMLYNSVVFVVCGVTVLCRYLNFICLELENNNNRNKIKRQTKIAI